MNEFLTRNNYQWDNAAFKTGISREILDRIFQAMAVRHIIAVTGVRRCGKSYLFRQIISRLIDQGVPAENIMQANFEDPYFVPRRHSTDILDELYREYRILKQPSGIIYLFLDEIQNIENWQYWVRALYDRDDSVRIFITGSNSDLLSTELATHLTGRVIPFEVFPFSYVEYFAGLNTPDILISKDALEIYQQLYNKRENIIHHIEKTFKTGLFPEAAFLENDELSKTILLQYFQGILFKDIVPRFDVRNSKVIEQLAYYAATNITSPFSYRKIAETLGSNENTIKEYISMIEKAYLFFIVDFYEYSLHKQFRRNRKPYMIDCGMRQAASFVFSEDRGRLAENSLYLTLRRQYNKIFYWQDERSQKEVDFVVEYGTGIIAVNSSYTDNIPDREYESFAALAVHKKADRNIIVSRDTFSRHTVDDIEIEVIPFWVFIFMKL